MRAGKGHKYWHNFSQEIQESIETLASSINRLLFDPIIQRPIKTLDLPICDRNNNILTLVYEFVSFVNNDTKEEDDLTGEATIRSLKRTERMVQLFSSVAPCSYGLHPLLYCYSNKGNFRPASFYGAIEFIRTLDTNPAILKSFIEQRKNFEDFIFENDIAVQRIIDTYRRGLQSARHISDYYVCVLNLFASGKTSVEVQESILANPKYQRLKLTFSPELEVTTGAFNSGNKSEVYIQEAYKKAPRCAICGGLLHTHSTIRFAGERNCDCKK